jgi:hypothetical protein
VAFSNAAATTEAGLSEQQRSGSVLAKLMRWRAPKKDRWGFKPVRRGWVRGRIDGLQVHIEADPFGEVEVRDFVLLVDENTPPVPVQMRGNSFNAALSPGWLVDVRDHHPSVRPLQARYLYFPPRFENYVKAFYPGADEPTPLQNRLTGAAFLLGPVLVAAALLLIYFLFVHQPT